LCYNVDAAQQSTLILNVAKTGKYTENILQYVRIRQWSSYSSVLKGNISCILMLIGVLNISVLCMAATVSNAVFNNCHICRFYEYSVIIRPYIKFEVILSLLVYPSVKLSLYLSKKYALKMCVTDRKYGLRKMVSDYQAYLFFQP
jgi:hypothetical protein